MSGWETKMVCEQEGGIKKESGRWIMMNGSAEDSRTSVATVWVSLHNSLSLQSSSPSLYQTLLLYCCSSLWPIKPYHWPVACQFYASALLIKDTHDTDTTMQLHSANTPGASHTHPVCSRSFVCVCVSISTSELFTNRLWICWLAGKQLTTFATCPSSRS